MLRTDIKLITPSQMTDNMIFALQEPLLLRIGQMFPPVFSQLLGAIFVNVERVPVAKSKFRKHVLGMIYVGPGEHDAPAEARLLANPATMANDSRPPESAPPEQSSSNSEPADNPIGSKSDGQVSSTQTQAPTSASIVPAQIPTEGLNREHLLDRARSFLVSPQVQNQDLPSKRAFLREKGLSEVEIENLLHTLVRAYLVDRRQTLNISSQPLHPPSIPPRTYPQPPPSNLPVLLLGIVRLFSWLAGGSAALIFFYRVSCCDNFLDLLAEFVFP